MQRSLICTVIGAEHNTVPLRPYYHNRSFPIAYVHVYIDYQITGAVVQRCALHL